MRKIHGRWCWLSCGAWGAGSSNIYFGDVSQPSRDQVFTLLPKHFWCSLVPDLGSKHSVHEGRQEDHRHIRKPLHKQLVLG